MKTVEYNRDKKIFIVKIGNNEENEKEQAFIFSADRRKNKNSGEEKLEIKCSFHSEDKNNDNYGEVVTSLLQINSDIYQFRKFGVSLNNTEFADLISCIQKNYLLLNIEEYQDGDIGISKEEIEGILDIVREWYNLENSNKSSEEVESKEKYFYMKVKDFTDEMASSIYSKYSITDIRQKLINDKMINCYKGRTTSLARINGKVERVVAFNISSLNI